MKKVGGAIVSDLFPRRKEDFCFNMNVISFFSGDAPVRGYIQDDYDTLVHHKCRPALVLCYPVITMGEYTHEATRDNVTGGNAELQEKLSLEKHIGRGMPPTFIWHTVDDESVPVENTLMLISALKRENIPFECHLFAHGKHGISVCTQEVETPNARCREWVPLCKAWLNDFFGYTP